MEGWPVARDLQGSVRFLGAAMDLQGSIGEIGGIERKNGQCAYR